jgi:ABC-type transporter Mla subunit MlaD
LIVALVATGAFVFFLADVRAALEHRYELIAVFPSAPRVRVGSPVWIGGHEIGRVTEIGLLPVRTDSAARVAVTVEIPRRYQPLIRSDSRARLSTARMIGEPAVDISSGSRSARMLVAGDTLFGVKKVDLMSAFSIWRGFQSSIDSLVRASKTLQPTIAQRTPQLKRLANRLEQSRKELAVVTSTFSGGSLAPLLGDSLLQPAFARLGETTQQLGPAFREAAARYQEPELRGALTRMSTRADSLSVRLRALSVQLANGSLARFRSDTAIQKVLHQTQADLDSLIAETKRNPLRFWLGNRK